MSGGVVLVLLALAIGIVAVAFETYGIPVSAMAWTLIAIGAGGLVVWLLQPLTRWSRDHIVTRRGRHTAGTHS